MSDPWAPIEIDHEPTPRRRRWPVVAAGVGVLVAALAVAGGITGAKLAGDPAPTSSPSPSRVLTAGEAMDEQAACVALVPIVSDAADLILATTRSQDPTAVDKDRLDVTTRDLKSYVRRIPEHMRGDVWTIIETLGQVEQMRMGNSYRIETSKAGNAGVAFGTRCQRYTR